MSQPTIEIAYSPATDAIKNSPHDRELVNAALSILKAQQGCIKCVAKQYSEISS